MALPTLAETPEIFKKLLHAELEKEPALLVFKDSTRHKIQRLEKEPEKTRIGVLQLTHDKLTEAEVATLLKWVEQGGSLWFHDCRFADKFGMEAAPVEEKMCAKAEMMTGHYGDRAKLKGLCALSFAHGDHVALLGVDLVLSYLMPVGDNKFSAVKATGDTVGLLRLTTTPDHPNAAYMAAAVRRHGKGTIIFKPMMWEENFKSWRLQANLREWAAGYPVPDIANLGSNTTAPDRKGPPADWKLFDQVELSNGDVLYGLIQNKEILFHAVGASLSDSTAYKREVIKEIRRQPATGLDLVVMRDGQEVQGLVRFENNKDLEVKFGDGTVKQVKKGDLSRVQFDLENKQDGK